MGNDPRVLRAADIIACGFQCSPYTPMGQQRGFDDEKHGDNFDLVCRALEERRTQGIVDRCILLENVPNLLNFLGPELLEKLGYHLAIYVVSGSYFEYRCHAFRIGAGAVSPSFYSDAQPPLRTVAPTCGSGSRLLALQTSPTWTTLSRLPRGLQHHGPWVPSCDRTQPQTASI